MTPVQALQNLYAATRVAPLTAEQHEICNKAAQILSEIVAPKEEPKKDAKKA